MKKSAPQKRILLADDDAAMRRFVEVMLTRAGYHLTVVEDGGTALQTALTENFAACVFDAVMPVLSGHELCRIFKEHPQLKDTPIILLSGLEANEKTLADAHLLKTANLQTELTEMLTRLLA